MFTMEGRRKIIGVGDDHTPSIFYREENEIKYYVTLIKAKSGDSFKLALTKVITKITQLHNRLHRCCFITEQK